DDCAGRQSKPKLVSAVQRLNAMGCWYRYAFLQNGRAQMDRAIIALAAAAILLGVSACSEPGRLDERGPTVWLVDGKKIQINRTYFRVQGESLAFAVE